MGRGVPPKGPNNKKIITLLSGRILIKREKKEEAPEYGIHSKQFKG